MFSRRKPRLAILFSAFLLTTPLLAASPAGAVAPSTFLALDLPAGSTGDPEKIIAAGLSRLAEQLNALPTLDGLQDAIPLSDTTLAEALDLVDRFDDLKTEMDALVGDAGNLTAADLEDAIIDAGGNGLTLTPNIQPPDGDITAMTLGFSISESVNIPFAATDGFPVSGGSVGATATLSGSFSFELDTSLFATDLDNSFYILTTPAPTLTAEVTATAPNLGALSGQLGISAVTIGGSAFFNLDAELTINDPDTTPPSDGKITFDEFDATAIVDLVSFAVIDTGDDVANVNLTIDSSLIGDPNSVDGSFSYVLANLGETPTINSSLNALADFENFTLAEAIAAFDRLAALLGGLQTTRRLDVELPLVGGGIGDVVNLEDRIRAALADMVKEQNDMEDNDNDGDTDEPGEDPIVPNFASAQELEGLLEGITGIGDVTIAHSGKALTFSFEVTDSANKTVYVGNTPPASEDDPLRLRFPDLDILNNVEITTGANATLNADYKLNLTFGFDLSVQPDEGGAGHGSCFDGLDNDLDGNADAADSDCEDALSLIDRVFLDVGSAAGTPEGTASATLTASGINATATVGILEVGVTGASVAINGPAETDNQARVTVDFFDTGDGRLTVGDLFDVLGDSPSAPAGADVETTLVADFAATVPVAATVGVTDLGAGNIVLSSSVNGAVTDVGQLITNLDINSDSLSASDIFNFSPCSNNIDDDGDGDINDGCPGSGVAANDSPESASTASLTQIIAAIRSFAQGLDGVGGGVLDDPIPLVGKSLNDLIDFADVVLDIAEDLENPAEGDGSMDGGPDCANDDDDDGDGFTNDGCPTVGDAPEGGGLAVSVDGNNCANDVSDDDDNGGGIDATDAVNDGCPAVSGTLSSIAAIIEDALQDALDAAIGQAVVPTTIDVTVAYDTAANEIIFDIDLIAPFSAMGSFNVAEGGNDLVGVSAAGDVGIAVTAGLDLDFGVDLDDITPFVLGSTGFSIDAQAAANDLAFMANIGPLEFAAGTADDPGSIHLGAAFSIGVTGAPTDRIPFGSLGFDSPSFGGVAQPDCADPTHHACATIPLYLNDEPVATPPAHQITVGLPDLTNPGGAIVTFPNLTSIIDDALIEFALAESGLARLIQVLTDVLVEGVLAVDFPLIGDQLHEAANFIAALNEGDGSPGSSGVVGIITELLTDGDPIEVAAKALTDLGNEQEVFVELSVTPVNETQQITTGGADGGTFSVSYEGSPTAVINWDDGDAAVTTAIEGLTGIGAGNVSVTGGAGVPWDIEFIGDLAETDVSELTVADVDLTNAALAVSTTQEGQSGGTFTLAKDGEAASDPIPWDATAAEVETALENGGGITDVDVSGTGTEADPWVIDNFTPNNPGKLVNDDTELSGMSTVELVTVIPTIQQVQDEVDGLIDDLEAALLAQDLLLVSVDPIVVAENPGEGEVGVTLLCDDAGTLALCIDDLAKGSDPATDIDGVRFDILIGQEATTGTDFSFDIGVPGLNLASNGSPTVTGEWHLDFGFGITKDDGFFIDTEAMNELFAGVSATLGPDNPTPALSGRMAFIGIEIYDGTEGLSRCATLPEPAPNTDLGPCATHGELETALPKSSLGAEFRINLVDPGTTDDGKLTFSEMTNVGSVGDVIEFNVAALADVNLHLESMISKDGSLPRVYADLEMGWAWNFGNGNVGSGEFAGMPCAEFDDCFSLALNNTAMDAGSFVTNFLAPVLEDVQKFTKPLQPVIDTLNEPIPVLSDLGAGPVTLLSLAESLGPDSNKYDLIFQLVKLIDFVNGIEARTGQRLIIPLGTDNDYTLDVERLLSGPVASEQSADAFDDTETLPTDSLVDGSGELNSFNVSNSNSAKKVSEAKSETGLSFPFLEQPSKVLGLLFGQDVDLIVWAPQPLSFGFSYSQRFGPIWAVPPVFLEVGGSVSVTGRFGIGYDTQGLREILFEDAGPEALLHGVFLLDRDASGRDVNELELKGELFANAQVSVLIFSAGAGGSVYATIGIDLQDPNSDGKLKFQEIADIIRNTGNPFCIFNLNGAFGVRIFVFAEVDLFFWSKRWSKTLADIVLYEFKIECEGLTEPVLAAPTATGAPPGVSGDALRLNLGKHRSGRDANGKSVGFDLKEEEFTVTQEADGSLTVEALGFSQNYEAADGTWESIWADGSGDGDPTDGTVGADKIILLDGGDEDPTSESDLNAAQTDFTVPAFFIGSGGDDTYITGAGDDVINSGDGADVIDTRDGNDAVDGGGGNDAITGGAGNDVELNGGPGNDYIDGGPGADTINGGGGDDELLGGADRKRSETEVLADGIDTIHGNDGEDDIDGGPGNDMLFGDADRDTIRGGDGDDTMSGGSGGNETECPTDNAGPGAGQLPPGGDVMYGGPGTDTMHGNGGDDIVIGGLSIEDSPDTNDNLFGDDGCDSLYGDNVEIDESGNVVAQQTTDSDLFGGDAMNGGDDDDLLLGQSGNDTMAGDNGADVLKGNDGNDTMYGDDSAGNVAGDGADIMTGNDGTDTMHGGGANDEMFGDDGNDTMFGNDGDDLMRGGRDNDQMSGNADSDEMFGDSGNDMMWGDDDDPLTLGDLADEMRGGIGDDYMFGNAGGDDMRGDSGNDRMVGGSAAAAEPDNTAPDQDEMRGGSGTDVMAGDNATISGAAVRIVVLRLDGAGDGDLMLGDTEADRMFGQAGDDDMFGGGADDYMEGNDGSDKIRGEDGDDDLIGGGSANAASNGKIDKDRVGDGLPDEADQIWGGIGEDWIAGDNARIDRNFNLGNTADLVLFDVNSTDTTTSGGDRIEGNANDDAIFGQGNGAQDPENEGDAPADGIDNDLDNLVDEDGGLSLAGLNPFLGDVIWAGSGNDYVEGNHGADLIYGESGEDDIIGGGSSEASGDDVGVIVQDGGLAVGTRNGSGLEDGRDTIYGAGSIDWIAGDNALLSRNFGQPLPIVLFDVNSTDATTSSGDYLSGGDSNDLMFGQGNGTQSLLEADPIDGVDNDFDGEVDDLDDQPWRGDVMFGDAGNDYMEGNHGSDLMLGGDGDDDMVGGGSANDDSSDETGTFEGSRDGNGLADSRDTMYGEAGNDWMSGDNSLIERNLDLGAVNDLVLFDVNSTDFTLSGGDWMDGGSDTDRMFGQGNGGQGTQTDPLDLVDNDGDGMIDENQPWFGDVMYGGTEADYMEGNHGSDLMFGDDADGDETNDGEDNMIGGGSASNGVIVIVRPLFNTARTGNALIDEGDIMRGEGGVDFMTGDNARIDVTGDLTGLTLPTTSDRSVQLFDVELTGNPVSTAYSGGDWMSGGGADDVMFGQGNGSQDPSQADPLDGIDNDLDGREDPTAEDLGWDCGDFGFDNDDDGDADGNDSDCLAAIDEDSLVSWDGDIMFGNDGDDYMEGNHGSDWMFGNADEDDMIGGGSANNGAIVPLRDPVGLTDGHDVISGGDEDDVMTGDNARINRVEVLGAWERITNDGLDVEAGFGDYDQAVRVTDMGNTDAGDDTHGDDYMEGNAGNDEMYGQLGDDFAIGGLGDDALVGDLGQVTANIIGDDDDDPDPTDISTNSPHWDDRIYELGSMWWETVLYANDTSQGGVGDDDILLGHDGRDTAFGGPGDDIINGDGDGTDEFVDAENPEFTHITDIDATTFDRDMLFGGDDDDVLWGGRDNDVLMGGWGADYLDVRPREAGDNGRNGAQFAEWDRDLPEWHAFGFPENFQDVDFIYGGWDRDAMQADQAANGPDPGDRLADWAGGFNVFYICPAGYGDYSITRQGSPHSLQFLRDLTEASGAIGSSTDGTSGFRELAYVFTNQRGDNSHPPHPDHAAHFTCADLSNAG